MAETTTTPAGEAPDDPEDLFDDDVRIDEALRRGVRDALLRHKQAGVPIVIRRDGQLVEVPADQIEVGPE